MSLVTFPESVCLSGGLSQFASPLPLLHRSITSAARMKTLASGGVAQYNGQCLLHNGLCGCSSSIFFGLSNNTLICWLLIDAAPLHWSHRYRVSDVGVQQAGCGETGVQGRNSDAGGKICGVENTGNYGVSNFGQNLKQGQKWYRKQASMAVTDSRAHSAITRIVTSIRKLERV